MFRKTLSLILVGLILNLAFYSTARANPNPEKEAKFAAKVKAAVSKLGTGTNAHIEVKLLDKTKLKGYVSEVRENNFVVVDSKTGATSEVPYSQVKGVKGKNNLTGQSIAIVAAAVAFLVLFAIYGIE